MLQRLIDIDYSTIQETENFTESNPYIQKMKEQAFSINFVSDIMLAGHSYKGKKSCGEFQFKACLNHDRHVGGSVYCRKVRFHCGSWGCNTCFDYTVKSRARAVSNRLTAFANLKKNRKIYLKENRVRVLSHVIVSPPKEEYYKFKTKDGRKKLKEMQRKILTKMGLDVDGGVTISHPYRFTRGLESAYFSPHYHNVITGWIDGSITKEIYDKTGWVVKQISNFDNAKNCYNVVKYLLSHTGVFLKEPLVRSSEHSITYFGECNNRKFKVANVLKFSESGHDQLSKIFQDKAKPKGNSKTHELYSLTSVSSDYHQIDDSIKKSIGYFEKYDCVTADNLTRIYKKYITPKQQDISIRDKPAITQSEPFELLQMRLDYSNSKGHIVQSEYLNIIFDRNLTNLCPECTLNMRAVVPNDDMKYGSNREDFLLIWNQLDDDGTTMKVDSLRGFEEMTFHDMAKGLPYVTEKGIWENDTGVYDLPEKLDYLPKQMRTIIEKSVEVQKIKYHYKMDNKRSISKEELSDKIKIKYTIQSPNQKLIDFI
jgi:hypothetical protein